MRVTSGTLSPPVWKESHEFMSALNSSVKNKGRGVGVNAGVEVKARVAVASSVGVRSCFVAVASCTGVGVVVWQALINTRHPMSSFFMASLITQSCGLLDDCVH